MTAARSKSPKAPVIRLVPKSPERRAPEVNGDTVSTLVRLLEMATKGEVIGLAYAAQYPSRKYFVDVAGEAYTNPTYARGMTRALDDHLAEIIGSRS